MTHPFVKEYTAVCKELLTPLGFKRKGRYFYRIINDVYQDLALKRYSDGETYSVFFGFKPFCCEIGVIDPTFSDFYLEKIAPILYYGRTDSEYRKNAEQLGKLISEHIIPIYKRAINVEMAFSEWNHLDQKIKNRYHLNSNEFCTREEPIWMAVALGDYEFAVKGLQERIARGTGRSVLFGNYEEILDRLQARDLVYLNNLVRDLEQASRVTLGLPLEG